MLAAVLMLAAAAPLPQDSAGLRRWAASAQAEFERTRRHHLPYTSLGGRCDARIGRYCYWYDEREPAAPPEPAVITSARALLLAHLDSASSELPGDPWIAGQRVRYLVEAGQPDAALAAAAECAAQPWWCAALAGFAHHAAHRFDQAEAAYARAQAAMPVELWCRWNDLEPLLEGQDAGPYRGLDCAGRDSANAVVLARSRPLLATRGNDLATEILARRTFVAMQQGAVTHHGSRMDDDLGDMILRYGWATGWSRRFERSGLADGISVIGHEPRPAYPFLAQGNGDDPAWPPDLDLARARYAPRYASTIMSLGGVQWARFRRQDSVVLVAAFAATERVSATLGAADVAGGRMAQVRGGAGNGRGVLRLGAHPAVRLASLEVEDTATRAWAVSRLPIDPASLHSDISDLLLLRPGPDEPGGLEDAWPRALPVAAVDGERVVALYWEAYFPRDTDVVAEVRLEVIPARPGLLARIGRSLGVGRRNPPLRLTWSRRLPAGDHLVPNTVELDLSRLRPGNYTVVVEMAGPDGVAVAAARSIAVGRAGN